VVRSQPRSPVGLFLAFLLLTAFAGLIVFLSARYLQTGEVRVPDVVGSNVQEASRALRALGFEVSTYTDNAASAAPERVTSQTPAADAVVRRGRGVALGVSVRQGQGEAVPTLVGLTQEEATAALDELQTEVAQLGFRHAPQPEGVVLEQRPAAGSALGNAGVALVVSLGPQPRRVALPRLTGLRVDVAQRRLEALGFRRIERVPTRLGPPGVNAQTPKAGTPTEVSAPVTLYYTVGNAQVVPVPSVVGLELQEAAERLQRAGLRVGWVEPEAFDPTKPSGVTEVSPADYTLWGTPVTLRTNGDAGDYRALEPAPPRRNLDQSSLAQRSSARNGPFAQLDAQPGTRTTESGLSPAPGSAPRSAAAQELPAGGGRTIPITLDPANYSFLQGRAYDFRVEVTDEAGDRVALSRTMAPDETVQDSVSVYGEAELRMYIDGQIVLAYNPTNP
jgi:beta-lactam-binding protein with PASTA domain